MWDLQMNYIPTWKVLKEMQLRVMDLTFQENFEHIKSKCDIAIAEVKILLDNGSL